MKRVLYTFKLPETLLERLKFFARLQNRSFNNMVETLLLDCARALEREHEKKEHNRETQESSY